MEIHKFVDFKNKHPPEDGSQPEIMSLLAGGEKVRCACEMWDMVFKECVMRATVTKCIEEEGCSAAALK